MKNKFKKDQEAKLAAMQSAAAANQNQNKNANNEENQEGGGANNLVVKDMPMIQFYSQLGARGQEMIKQLKKYDFQEKKDNKYPTKAI